MRVPERAASQEYAMHQQVFGWVHFRCRRVTRTAGVPRDEQYRKVHLVPATGRRLRRVEWPDERRDARVRSTKEIAGAGNSPAWPAAPLFLRSWSGAAPFQT